jgi:hypothetical protein
MMARYDQDTFGYRGRSGYDRAYRPRVTARYNRDYVTGYDADQRPPPNYARWGGVRNDEAGVYRQPYQTTGGTRTGRGTDPRLWREEEARRRGREREHHPGRPWWAHGPSGYDERAGMRPAPPEGWRPRYSPVGGMQPGYAGGYDRDLPRDLRDERWFSDRTRWF